MQKSVFHRHANDIQLANALSLGFPMMTAASDQTADKPLTQLERLNNARRRVNRLMQRIAGKLYDGNFQQCWVEELMKPYRADWTTVKNTWTLFQIEELAEKLEARLVEAFKNGN